MQLRGQGVIGSESFRPRLDNFRQRYAASLRYLDAEMGILLDELRRRGRYDEALIWVVSDHGEAFGEHDVAGHTGLALGNELLHVPLLVKLPKSWGVAPRSEPVPVSAYSILPTTLSLLGLPPLPVAFGEDLSPLLRGDRAAAPGVVFADSIRHDTRIYAAIRWPWKLVALAHGGGPLEPQGLFDLSSADGEGRSRSADEPERVAALLRDIEGYRARVAALAAARAAAPGVDAQTEEQLRKLGYIQ
jgi:arylsulfatase A-like enzyme